MKRFKVHEVVISLLLLIFLTVPVYLDGLTNVDTWKNLVTGKYLFLFQKFPHYSTFTIAPVEDFVAEDSYDWLGSLIIYSFYYYMGYSGLTLLKFLPLVVFWFTVNKFTRFENSIDSIAFIAFISYCVSTRIIARDSIFGLVLFTCVFFVWGIYIRKKDRRFLWIIPIILVFWSNLHGSFQIGGLLLFAIWVGSVLEYLLFRSIPLRTLISIFLVGTLSLLSVHLVKPQPGTIILSQFNSLIKGTTSHTETVEIEQSATSERNYKNDFKKLLKNISHDLLIKSRPHISHEFQFSLKRISGLDYIGFFILVPTFLIIFLFTRADHKLLNFIVFFSIVWVGLSFQRSVAYMNIGILMLLMIYPPKKSLFSASRTTKIFENFFTSSRVASVLLIICFTGSVWFAFKKGIPIWGKHPSLKSEIPVHLSRQYKDDPIYNEAFLGSLLLFEWWPQKKVFWWQKFTSYQKDFLIRIKQKNSLFDLNQEYNFKIFLMTTRSVEDRTLLFEKNPEWKTIAKDHLMTAFCKC